MKPGVTLDGLYERHWTDGPYGDWYPLTSISHMLDCQFYGLWPPGHHLTNVLLHAAAVVLLFLVLLRMTGQRCGSPKRHKRAAVREGRASGPERNNTRKPSCLGGCVAFAGSSAACRIGRLGLRAA